MTKPLDPYSRVYWRVLHDERFDDIRADMRHFGSWTLMLLVADMAYPVPAFIPPTIPKASLTKLTEVGLIEVLRGGLYRVHGLTAERTRRWGPRAEPDGNPSGPSPEPDRTPSGAGREPLGTLVRADGARQAENETRRDETSTHSGRAPDDPADAYWSLTGKYPTDKVLTWIDDLTSKYGGAAVIGALAQAHIADRATQTLLGRTQDRLRAEARALDRKEQEDEKARLREKRAIPRVIPEWEQEYRAVLERQYGATA